MRVLAITTIGLMLGLGLAACVDRDGPFEEMGENLDNATEELRDDVEDACEEMADGMNAEDANC
ncbi:MAG: hypothetical protein HKM98_04320 [Gammaproteobacteria bacterium]|nr:hypothetical protein [Gammaproteobacteria bacterium]